jgi:uncharacterized phage protein (TIGR02220 family)
MAENKKSFILYCDLIHTIKKLPDDKAGLLFKHLLSYVNDENPETDDLLVEVAFEPIKRQLKRDLQKFEEVKVKRSEAGKLGGRPKNQTKAKKANAFLEKQTKAKKADNDNDNDNVINISIDFDKLIEIYNSIYGRQIRVIPTKAKKQIRERLKEGYTKKDFVTALENAKNDQYHRDNNYKYITLEFISRPDKFERYSSNHNFKVQTKIL